MRRPCCWRFLPRWNNHRGNPWFRIWCRARTWRRHWRFNAPDAMCPSSPVHLSRACVWPCAAPPLAGVVLAMCAPAACYTVDALSWLAMMTSLALLRTKIPEGGGWKTVSLRSLGEGRKFVWGHGALFSVMVLDFAATFFGNARA